MPSDHAYREADGRPIAIEAGDGAFATLEAECTVFAFSARAWVFGPAGEEVLESLIEIA